MGKRRDKTLPLIEGLEITALAAEGNALGRWENQVVFVRMGAVGDVVDVQIFSRKRRFMEGRIVNFVKRSPLRAEPVCEHFGVCGGCKWQHLPYSEQLRQKQAQVEEQLTRIGRVELPEISPILGSEKTELYRNKLEFSFAPRRWMTSQEMSAGIEPGPALGFHIPGMFDRVLDIRECHLQPDPSNGIRTAIRDFCVENGYTFHNVRDHSGLMRGVTVRTAATGEVMVVVAFSAEFAEGHMALLDHLRERFPQIASLMYAVNGKLNDSLDGVEIRLHSGRGHIEERMEGLRFRVGPRSFYQTNSAQAYELYKIVRRQAALSGGEVLYDLYTGTGTIANFVAAGCRKVIGVEYVPEAIEDAKENSRLNGIDNTEFFAGDMKDILTPLFVEAHGRPDVVVLDPPRAGVHEDVARVLLQTAPRRIVYVSCNPATQARDLALLDEKYAVEHVQPVDMFPHTHHVENVATLTLRQ